MEYYKNDGPKNLHRRACAKNSLRRRCLALHREIKVLPVELPAASMPNGIVTLKNSTLSSVAKLSSNMRSKIAQRPREERKSRHVGLCEGFRMVRRETGKE